MHLWRLIFLPLPFLLIILPTTGVSGNLLEIAELLAHPEQYDRQEIVVTGQVTNLQLATNRQGQPAYGFLLKDHAGKLKVINLRQADAHVAYQHTLYPL